MPTETLQIEWWPIDRPRPYPKNARKIPQRAIDLVAKSLREFGWQQAIVVDAEDVIIAGHTRLLAARQEGHTRVPVSVAAHLTPAQVRAYRLMDNRAHEETSWNDDILAIELGELKGLGMDWDLAGFGDFKMPEAIEPRMSLSERFGVPPFSVLDARQGYWQDRKRAWLALGIQSELGRGGTC